MASLGYKLTRKTAVFTVAVPGTPVLPASATPADRDFESEEWGSSFWIVSCFLGVELI